MCICYSVCWLYYQTLNAKSIRTSVIRLSYADCTTQASQRKRHQQTSLTLYTRHVTHRASPGPSPHTPGSGPRCDRNRWWEQRTWWYSKIQLNPLNTNPLNNKIPYHNMVIHSIPPRDLDTCRNITATRLKENTDMTRAFCWFPEPSCIRVILYMVTGRQRSITYPKAFKPCPQSFKNFWLQKRNLTDPFP